MGAPLPGKQIGRSPDSPWRWEGDPGLQVCSRAEGRRRANGNHQARGRKLTKPSHYILHAREPLRPPRRACECGVQEGRRLETKPPQQRDHRGRGGELSGQGDPCVGHRGHTGYAGHRGRAVPAATSAPHGLRTAGAATLVKLPALGAASTGHRVRGCILAPRTQDLQLPSPPTGFFQVGETHITLLEDFVQNHYPFFNVGSYFKKGML